MWRLEVRDPVTPLGFLLHYPADRWSHPTVLGTIATKLSTPPQNFLSSKSLHLLDSFTFLIYVIIYTLDDLVFDSYL